MANELILKALYHHSLSDIIVTQSSISKKQADKIFQFFKNNPLFRWDEVNNNCENRANAICILLDEWNIPNAKGWTFSGYLLNKIGYLKNLWKYHVAAIIPVSEDAVINFYVIDPATSDILLPVADWAANITDNPHSYYFLKDSDFYIFNEVTIKKNNWYKRDRRNYNWTMQGLSGINGLSGKGKAQLTFYKDKIPSTKKAFELLRNSEHAPF
jgi:hypothetical protein